MSVGKHSMPKAARDSIPFRSRTCGTTVNINCCSNVFDVLTILSGPWAKFVDEAQVAKPSEVRSYHFLVCNFLSSAQLRQNDNISSIRLRITLY